MARQTEATCGHGYFKMGIKHVKRIQGCVSRGKRAQRGAHESIPNLLMLHREGGRWIGGVMLCLLQVLL